MYVCRRSLAHSIYTYGPIHTNAPDQVEYVHILYICIHELSCTYSMYTCYTYVSVYTYICIMYSIFDVGGQRGERRKWIHCFNGMSLCLFIAIVCLYTCSGPLSNLYTKIICMTCMLLKLLICQGQSCAHDYAG